MNNIKGEKIMHLDTIGSRYANGYIRAFDKDNNEYRVHIRTLIQMFDRFKFQVKMKRVYPHLEEPEMIK